MRVTRKVKQILCNYESDNPGTLTNLARMLTHGKLANTGQLIILPVDQGFEHGPVMSFGMNRDAMDPHYHYQLAVDGGVSAFAAPLGLIEAGAVTFAGAVPLILKMNSSNRLVSLNDQGITASIQDALQLGCSAVGFTIYPGSDASLEMFEEIAELSREAKSCGLAVVIWSYPRGNMSKKGETAIDTIAYGAHMASLLGAHIVKVKLPTAHVESTEAQKVYDKEYVDISSLTARVRLVVQSCFAGRRLVVFSGGEAKSLEDVYQEARAIRDGGGAGSIIGRNCFQRPKEEALGLLNELVTIYKKNAS